MFAWISRATPDAQKLPPVKQAPIATSSAGIGTDLIASRLSHDTLALDGVTTWQPNAFDLPGLMNTLGMAPSDPPVVHHHQHLDILINGVAVPVPHNIGLSRQAEVPVHTHGSEGEGIIHVETTDANFKPTLGMFFDVWGVSFSESNIGGYVADGQKTLAVFVNGTKFVGNPREIPLNQHDEIVIVFGSTYPDPMPKSFVFPDGL